MTGSENLSEVAGLLVTTARAHHEATGGVNPRWALWYAEYLVDGLNAVLETSLSVSQLESWLIDADRRFTGEPQSSSWPKAYASWLLAEYG